MEKEFEGKVAMVTGGGHGIGREIALQLAKRGAFVLIADRDLQEAKKTLALLGKFIAQGKAYRLDVSKKGEVDLVFKQVRLEFGRLDILINNAGLFSLQAFERIAEKEWDRVLNTNLKGTFLCSQAAFKMMKSQNGGRIINISSDAARSGGMGSPGLYHPCSHYAASKAGIECLTRSMAFEGAPHGIRVNAVSPGLIETEMARRSYSDKRRKSLRSAIPLGRFCQPREVASAVLFLASDRASYITAKVLDVNGGLLMD